ncbi:putative toxin-antitoxin system toxin component, PIN family [Rhizobium leguminosarum bv. trifolii]|uniref:Putative toxin-antitoxin system toxin component, PIN family n=2 Tax=Rhizobium leguminosarum TaxID=384 RepID=A0A3E1BHY3_RHILT|nr:putative toxin-antitoxin system toxin component, PIN family [Rhizobium leguminosarum bv. trifolii]RFB92470.1 putative toxin-antitoxin system toxin component, PIN family [Rhizobium leguminosarum bv. trifolii]
MKRVVLDTNILTAALRSRTGASFAILQLTAKKAIRPLVTTALFLEYEAVLKRPEHVAVHGFTPSDIDGLMAEMAALAEAVDVHFRWRPQLSDPQDELVFEAAVNGRADALVTHNIRDFEAVKDRFALRVIRPSELLEEIRK